MIAVAELLLRRVLRRLYRTSFPVSVRAALALQRELVQRESVPLPIEPPTARRVVVLAPHADDEVFGCGGALARAAQQGCETRVVFMTDGRKGYDASRAGADLDAFEHALAATRKQEARRAGSVLGLGEPVFLDLPDGALASSPGAADALADALRQLSPEIVLLPYFADPHPDHWATVKHFLACATQAGLPASLPCWGYEVWTPLVANAFLDITSVMPLKKQAMAVYQSQVEAVDYPRVVSGLNAYRALAAGFSAGYAEAFFVDTLAGYTRLFRQTWPHADRSVRGAR